MKVEVYLAPWYRCGSQEGDWVFVVPSCNREYNQKLREEPCGVLVRSGLEIPAGVWQDSEKLARWLEPLRDEWRRQWEGGQADV